MVSAIGNYILFHGCKREGGAMKRQVVTLTVLVGLLSSVGVVSAAETTFSYGGYVKMDVISTYYRNGDVESKSPLRDFHLPSQIPYGPTDENYDLDFHVKESRFHFQTVTTIDDHEIKGFVELDSCCQARGTRRSATRSTPGYGTSIWPPGAGCSVRPGRRS
jgi:hypothetical protein